MRVMAAMIMVGQLQVLFFGLAALALVYRRPSIGTVVPLPVCLTFQRVSTFSLASFCPISHTNARLKTPGRCTMSPWQDNLRAHVAAAESANPQIHLPRIVVGAA